MTSMSWQYLELAGWHALADPSSNKQLRNATLALRNVAKTH